MRACDLFDWPDEVPFAGHFPSDLPPWEWLRRIGPALAGLEPQLPADVPPGVRIEGAVWLHPTVRLPHVATLVGPAWIGPEVEIRPGAYLRGQVIVGPRSVLGNACEFKNCLLLAAVQVPHFSYVGDSILGRGAHLGAGVILSNLRLDQRPVRVRDAAGRAHDTGLRKVGAFVGDGAEVGCNAVLQPGTVLGRRALVHPCLAIGGHVAAGHTVTAARRTVVMPRTDLDPRG